MLNGSGPCPQIGQTGGPPATGLPSLRLGPHGLINRLPGPPPSQMPMQAHRQHQPPLMSPLAI